MAPEDPTRITGAALVLATQKVWAAQKKRHLDHEKNVLSTKKETSSRPGREILSITKRGPRRRHSLDREMKRPQKENVISTEAPDNFTVRRAVERPLYLPLLLLHTERRNRYLKPCLT
jgi:hypothetical protein